MPSTQEYLAVAHELFDKKYFNEAITVYSLALEKNPQDPAILVGYGDTLCRLYRFDEAQKNYQLALETNPDNPGLILTLGDLQYEPLRDWAAAEKSYTDYLAKRPHDDSVWTKLGHTQKQQKKYADAQINYQKALSINQQNHAALFEVANNLYYQKDYDAAEKTYQEAIRCDSDNTDLYSNRLADFYLGRGYNSWRNKNYAIAESYYQKAFTIKPNDISILKKIGELQSYQKKHADAEVTFQKILAIAPNDIDSLKALGKIQKTLENYPKAIEYYKKTLTLASHDTNIIKDLGDIYAIQKDFHAAIKTYQGASHDNNYMLIMVAHMYEELNDDNSALKYYEKYLKKEPLDSIHMSAGDIYLKQKKYAEAEKHYSQALALWSPDRNDSDYITQNFFLNFAKVQLLQNKYFQAEKNYQITLEKVLQSLPNGVDSINDEKLKFSSLRSRYSLALRQIGYIQYIQHQFDKAEKSCRRSIELNSLNPTSLIILASLKYQQKQIPQASNLLEECRHVIFTYSDTLDVEMFIHLAHQLFIEIQKNKDWNLIKKLTPLLDRLLDEKYCVQQAIDLKIQIENQLAALNTRNRATPAFQFADRAHRSPTAERREIGFFSASSLSSPQPSDIDMAPNQEASPASTPLVLPKTNKNRRKRKADQEQGSRYTKR